MNKGILEDIADLLMYTGPSIEEIISDASFNGQISNLQETGKYRILCVESKLPYELYVLDTYTYNLDNELIRHTTTINKKEKIVFDKFKQINSLITSSFENIAFIS